MIGRIYQIIAFACIAATLSMIGLIGWMSASGRLNAENLEILARIMRGQPLVDEQPEEPADAVVPSQDKSEQVAMKESVVELKNLQLDRREKELAYQQQALRLLEKKVTQEREQLRIARVQFLEEHEAALRRSEDAGFRRQLRLYEQMHPRQVKDVFMSIDEALAAQYLSAMNARTAEKVLSEFKQPDERVRMLRLLEQMRTQG